MPALTQVWVSFRRIPPAKEEAAAAGGLVAWRHGAVTTLSAERESEAHASGLLLITAEDNDENG